MLAADEIKIENITFQSDTSQEVNATITLARIFHESILNFMWVDYFWQSDILIQIRNQFIDKTFVFLVSGHTSPLPPLFSVPGQHLRD